MTGTTTLTEEEARVLYTLANRTWVPGFAYQAMQTALHKLLLLGGGECCRECAALGTSPDRLGGMVCREHNKRPPLPQYPLPTQEHK